MMNLIGARSCGANGPSREKLIAPTVVAIGMGVDDGVNRSASQKPISMAEHLTCVVQVPAGVDEHGLVAASDQTDIGFTPTAIWNQPCVGVSSQLIQAFIKQRASAHTG
jgi:hypothetical protein